MSTTNVPLLRTAPEIADWLDAGHSMADNAAAFDRLDAHLGSTIRTCHIWADAVAICDHRKATR